MKKIVAVMSVALCAMFIPDASAQSAYRVLYRFGDVADDGMHPTGDLVQHGTTLYGMTEEGGGHSDGVIFSIGVDGTGYATLYDFGDVAGDGATPRGSLIAVDGTLYGVTQNGGTVGEGIIFSIGADGAGYAILHNFGVLADDGEDPYEDLLSIGANLYGMTRRGGSFNDGIVFSVDPSDVPGTYQVLHHFNEGANDGGLPEGGLIYYGGRLYGMTKYGGKYSGGSGTVFSMNTDGSGYTILHHFDGEDGAVPRGSLVSDGSTLYGMTQYGGAPLYLSPYHFGGGTIFSIGTEGTDYTVLHRFEDGFDDICCPRGDLLLLEDGTLYGMAQRLLGGIFSIRPDGSGYTLLRNFLDGLAGDGIMPYGSLISDGTNLYGMTKEGGNDNDGVIFSYAIPTPTPTPTATPVPNYINLEAGPLSVSPGGVVTLNYACDFSRWDFQGLPVDIYLAAVADPLAGAVDAPSSVADTLSGGAVYLFGRGMRSVYLYTGRLREPTWSFVSFPPAATSGSVRVTAPASALFAGDYVFATAFMYSGVGLFIRDDGLPVENSNIFTIQ